MAAEGRERGMAAALGESPAGDWRRRALAAGVSVAGAAAVGGLAAAALRAPGGTRRAGVATTGLAAGGGEHDLLVPPQPRARHTVRSDDGTVLAVAEYGRPDGPTVVLAHGWTCTGDFWAPQIRALAGTARVLTYDQRGHGASAQPAAPWPAGYSTVALAEDLRAVITGCVPAGERVVLVGHSMGGMTLVAFAHQFPDLVERLVAGAVIANSAVAGLLAGTRVVPVPDPLRPAAARLTRRLISAPVPARARGRLGHLTVRRMALTRQASAAQVEFCRQLIDSCPPRVRAGWGRVIADLDLRGSVGLLTAPTTVISGLDDRLIHPDRSRALAAALPRLVELVELPGVGHMAPVEAPHVVTRAIADLVDRQLGERAA
ncbi:MAG: alpha/beta hydrolase [Frankia sp.]|nr:alpha/beta hydrolase [Frankia sp.]